MSAVLGWICALLGALVVMVAMALLAVWLLILLFERRSDVALRAMDEGEGRK